MDLQRKYESRQKDLYLQLVWQFCAYRYGLLRYGHDWTLGFMKDTANCIADITEQFFHLSEK